MQVSKLCERNIHNSKQIVEQTCTFLMKKVPVEIINSLRRIMLRDLNDTAFTDIQIVKKSTLLNDEMLAHSIQLIPIKVECEEQKEPFVGTFNIDESNFTTEPKYVTSSDIQIQTDCKYQIYHDLIICQLRQNEELKAVGKIKLDCPKNRNALFRPVVNVCFRPIAKLAYDPEIEGILCKHFKSCEYSMYVKNDTKKVQKSKYIITNDLPYYAKKNELHKYLNIEPEQLLISHTNTLYSLTIETVFHDPKLILIAAIQELKRKYRSLLGTDLPATISPDNPSMISLKLKKSVICSPELIPLQNVIKQSPMITFVQFETKHPEDEDFDWIIHFDQIQSREVIIKQTIAIIGESVNKCLKLLEDLRVMVRDSKVSEYHKRELQT